MCRLSEQQQSIEYLFFPSITNLADNLLERSQLPCILWMELMFCDWADIADLLDVLMNNHHTIPWPRSVCKEHGPCQAVVSNVPDYHFNQALRTSADRILYVLNKIHNHVRFIPRGNLPQLPIPHPLA